MLAFGPFRLFADERRLERDGQPVALGSRALDLLILLAGRAGEVVTGRELLETIWRDVTVEDSSLRFQIKLLRKALGDEAGAAHYVANVSGRGYSFVAPIKRPASPEAARGTLPARTASIVGRADSIDTVSRELLQRRLVTLAGPGGIGKTTLAIATAASLRGGFGDSVFFVDLAPVGEPRLVVSALAATLSVALRAEDPVQSVLERLNGLRVLLVFDNCEHVIAAAAALAERILQEIPEAHILATSREPLQIAGERVHRLMPLDCPPLTEGLTVAEALAYSAMQLFFDRAGVAAPVAGQIQAAGEICRRLDGIPLAIELAAARVESLGVAALAKELSDMFALLTQGDRLAVPRHATLRATLDWSYALLAPDEQAMLRRLAIFRTGFTLDSAIAVAGAPLRAAAIDSLGNLIAKSLLTTHSIEGTVQYRLLEATRLYAAEKLAESGDLPATARRHAEHQLALVAAAPVDWESDASRRWRREHAGRIDNVMAALDWAFAPEGDAAVGLELITVSAQYWFQLSTNLEYCRRIEQALAFILALPAPDPMMELRLQVALGHALWYTAADPAVTERAFSRAFELSESLAEVPVPLRLQTLWGVWAGRRGRGFYRDALAAAERYAAVASTYDDTAFQLLGDRILGLTHHYLGHQDLAEPLLQGVRRRARGVVNPPNTDLQLGPEIAAGALLVRILWLRGLPEQAEAALDAAMAVAQQTNHWFSVYYVLGLAGCPLAFWQGDLARAEGYLDRMVNRSRGDRWRGCWALVLRLRRGDAGDALTAAFLEPRIDLSTFLPILQLAAQPSIAVPLPAKPTGDADWCLPEILRVNAELMLWHKLPDAAAAAEATLRRAIGIARQQTALAWELRAATRLARLWADNGRNAAALDLLAPVCARFTEGFGTVDFQEAQRLIDRLR